MSQVPPRPNGPPTPSSLAAIDDFNKLVDSSLTDTRAAAEKWRTGLASFVTLVTTALLIKGPQQTTDITTGWRIVITATLGAGVVFALGGLWAALSAAAGIPSTIQFDSIIKTFGSVRAFQIAQANSAVRLLKIARRLILVSLTLLFCGMFTWWWAPTNSSPSTTVASFTAHANQTDTRIDLNSLVPSWEPK